MGQYWYPVNLDRREFVNPHKLGAGLKLGEQLDTHVGSALIVLTAALREHRGGGDFDYDTNYYGPERTEAHPSGAPVNVEYNVIAKRTIGRWAGDRIAIVGDYAERKDLPRQFDADLIYSLCGTDEQRTSQIEHFLKLAKDGDAKYRTLANRLKKLKVFRDVSDDVCAVIEHECGGKFVGEDWREFKQTATAQSV